MTDVFEKAGHTAYVVYDKTTEGIPWWAKAVMITGIAGAGIFAVYEIVKGITTVPPAPNLQQLMSQKQQFVQQYITTYNSYTQNGTKSLTQDQINSLNQLAQQITNINKQIEDEYRDQLQAQQALSNSIFLGVVAAVGIITTGAVTVSVIKAYWNKPKTPPRGGSPVAPSDILNQAISTSFANYTAKYSWNIAYTLTATELTLGIEALSYAYQYLGNTSQAINILNAYLPVANQFYNTAQAFMNNVSNDYVSNAISQADFLNTMVALDVNTAALIALLEYYSVEGFYLQVNGWSNNAVNAQTLSTLETMINNIMLLSAFFVVSAIAYEYLLTFAVALAA